MIHPVWWGLLLAATFLSRWWPRLVRPHARSTDAFFHLLQARTLRRRRFRIGEGDPRFVRPGGYVYPPGYHYLLAAFSDRYRERVEGMSSAAFDTALVALFAMASGPYLIARGWPEAERLGLAAAFALSPALVSVAGGPRAYEGTPRTLAELLGTAIFVCLWRQAVMGGWAWLAFAIALATVALLTSKFVAQVLVFFCGVMALLLDSATLLVLPVVCAVAAVVLSGGHYGRVLAGSVRFLHVYARSIAPRHLVLTARRRWGLTWTVRDLAVSAIGTHVPVIAVTRFGVSIVALACLAWSAMQGTLALDTGESFLAAWLIAGAAAWAVTSSPIAQFLGESERYLEYALLPGFLLAARFVSAPWRPAVLGAVIGAHAGLYLVHSAFHVYQHRPRPLTTGMDELIEALRRQPAMVLLSLTGQSPWEFALRTHHRLCFSEATWEPGELREPFFWRYPYPTPDLAGLRRRYDVGLIAVSKAMVKSAGAMGCVYDLSGFDRIFENDAYELYRSR